MTNMDADIKMLSNESSSGSEKENKVKWNFFYGDIKAKEKDVADTEKKLIGAMKQEEINPTKYLKQK